MIDGTLTLGTMGAFLAYQMRVFAPRNPIIEVASFHFVPQRSLPRVSTRIRLAKPQHVVAVAEMNEGVLLMTTTWVRVATDGCA